MPSRISNLAGFTTSLSSTTDLSVGVITATSLSVSGNATLGDIQISSGIISAVSGVITYFGDASSLTGISAGSSITDDTSTDSSFYPLFTNSTSGIITSANVSSTKLTFNPSSATLNVGSGVTITGDGDISIAGTIYASDIVTPIKIITFSPADGATGVTTISAPSVEILFDREVGVGTTGFIRFKGGTGTIIETIGVANTSRFTFTNSNRTLKITPTNPFAKGTPGIANTITTIIDKTFLTESTFLGINTTGSNVTYSFTMATVVLGEAYEGGYFICYSGGVQWIVAPSSTQVSRNWYTMGDANTCAQIVSGCTGWFIPNLGQLLNPGYICRSYWDSYTPTLCYWSNSPNYPFAAWTVCFANGSNVCVPKDGGATARSFRCVTY